LVQEFVQLKMRFLVLGTLALLLGGCAGVTSQIPSVPAGTSGAAGSLAPSPSPVENIPVEPAPKPAVSASQAVVSLVDRARIDASAGQREAAGASLERALRIEPRNPWLWQELAQLRLSQGQYLQAISLAQKSMSFSGQDRSLRALNWRVIGNARVAQGDASGAEQALKLATDFEQ
jgi:tetratricopeptide (TPR) repeat protein